MKGMLIDLQLRFVVHIYMVRFLCGPSLRTALYGPGLLSYFWNEIWWRGSPWCVIISTKFHQKFQPGSELTTILKYTYHLLNFIKKFISDVGQRPSPYSTIRKLSPHKNWTAQIYIYIYTCHASSIERKPHES